MEHELQQDNKNAILSLIRSGRIPQTIIIEGGDRQERENAAILLAAGMICRGEERPCLRCNACAKVLAHHHPDVFLPEPSKTLKSGILSLKDLRDSYLSQMSIRPNEADGKVYVFREADKLLREDSQNALLKTIEEPPQRLYFIFTAESAAGLLLTVRSRARIITLRHNTVTDEESEAAAKSIVDGLVESYEYALLKALSQLSDKDRLRGALAALTEKLRLTLSFFSGIATDDPSVRRLTRKLDRARVIALITVTNEALQLLNTNVSIQLLTTWLCSRYRRITWQK